VEAHVILFQNRVEEEEDDPTRRRRTASTTPRKDKQWLPRRLFFYGIQPCQLRGDWLIALLRLYYSNKKHVWVFEMKDHRIYPVETGRGMSNISWIIRAFGGQFIENLAGARWASPRFLLVSPANQNPKTTNDWGVKPGANLSIVIWSEEQIVDRESEQQKYGTIRLQSYAI
jgi:hypothetical protein